MHFKQYPSYVPTFTKRIIGSYDSSQCGAATIESTRASVSSFQHRDSEGLIHVTTTPPNCRTLNEIVSWLKWRAFGEMILHFGRETAIWDQLLYFLGVNSIFLMWQHKSFCQCEFAPLFTHFSRCRSVNVLQTRKASFNAKSFCIKNESSRYLQIFVSQRMF